MRIVQVHLENERRGREGLVWFLRRKSLLVLLSVGSHFVIGGGPRTGLVGFAAPGREREGRDDSAYFQRRNRMS